MAQPIPPPFPAPGWYTDPWGADGQRYWDGRTWSPLLPPTPGSKPSTASAKGRAVFVLALVLIAGGCVAMFIPGNHSSTSSDYTPPPGVSSTDRAFLKAIHGHGLEDSQGDKHMITVAHAICIQLDLGQTVEGLSEHWGLTNEKLSTESARFYVRTAAAAYCPQHL